MPLPMMTPQNIDESKRGRRMVEATTRRVLPGSRFPLGATPDGAGTNFALFSEHADEGGVVPLR